jgi:hypothetical protein
MAEVRINPSKSIKKIKDRIPQIFNIQYSFVHQGIPAFQPPRILAFQPPRIPASRPPHIPASPLPRFSSL